MMDKIEPVDFTEKPPLNLYILNLCCALVGFATRGSRESSIVHRIQKSSFAISFLLSIYAVLLQSYFILATGTSSVHFCRILFNLLTIKPLLNSCRRGHKFDEPLKKLLLELGPKYRRTLFRSQLLPLIVLSALAIAANCNLIRCLLTNHLEEVEALMHGSNNFLGSKLLTTFSYLNFEFGCLTSVISFFYYIQVQELLKLYAEKCEDQFPLMARSGDVVSIHNCCQFFNQIRRVSNKVMSFIPFHAFASKWMFFVFGLTTAISNKEKFASFTNVSIFICIILLISFVLWKIVLAASRADMSMKRARGVASELLNAEDESVRLSQINGLNNYFVQEKVVPATVWIFFDIEPSLLPVSLNSMITFSVMALTTASAFLK